jgi:proteasome lid subunit RPN8/RPN11
MKNQELKILPGVLTAVAAHAERAAPAECCGILLGLDSEIVEAFSARNLSDDPGRFLVDPSDHFAARRAARERGLDVVGFYHSHPHSPPEPSATDLAEASYPDSVHLIVSLRSASPAVKLFRFRNNGFLEVPFK